MVICSGAAALAVEPAFAISDPQQTKEQQSRCRRQLEQFGVREELKGLVPNAGVAEFEQAPKAHIIETQPGPAAERPLVPAILQSNGRDRRGSIGLHDHDEAPAYSGGTVNPHGELEAGALLGQYQIERPLGHGGMGAVFLAYDRTLHRRVALKVLDGMADAETSRTRLLREARNAAALNHPNICTVYEVTSHRANDTQPS